MYPTGIKKTKQLRFISLIASDKERISASKINTMQDVVLNNHFLSAGLHRGSTVHQANAADLGMPVITGYASFFGV